MQKTKEKNIKVIITVFPVFFFLLYTSKPQIIINEVQNCNVTTLFDEDGDTPDWIELYNTSDTTVNLLNYSITDDSNFPQKWIFPDISIPPHEYLLLFASGKDRKNQTYGQSNSSSGFGHWKQRDDFTFQYIVIDGDVDISLQLSYFEIKNKLSECGIMIRELLNEKSRFISCVYNHTSKLNIQINPSLQPDIEKDWFKMWEIDYAMNFPNVWIRLIKEKDSISFYYSETGNSWHFSNKIYFNLTQPCFLGISHTSGDKNVESNCFVKNLKINNESVELSKLSKINLGSSAISKNTSSFHHLSFKLSKEGDSILIFTPKSQLELNFSLPELSRDISYGIDENFEYKFFRTPTPKSKNEIGYSKLLDSPTLTHRSGIYFSPIIVRFIKEDNTSIYYLLYSQKPTTKSKKWENENIALDTNTIIRAIAINEDAINSHISTFTFLFSNNSTLPVLSLVSEPTNFFSDSIGIFVLGNKADSTYPYSGANFWSDNEFESEIEYFIDDKLVYKTNCGVSLQGNLARVFEQKSLKLIARNRYNDDEFKFNFFEELAESNYRNRYSLRTGSIDWTQSMLRDPLATRLCQKLNLDDIEYSKPINVFINGNYWGIYNLQTKINESYLSDKYKLNEDSLNILLSVSFPINGDNNGYIKLIDSINNPKLQESVIFDIISHNFNLSNFIDYFFIESFSANYDWPFNNTKIWNEQNNSPKWKWIPYDFDETFMEYHINSSMFDIFENENLLNQEYNVFYDVYKKLIKIPIFRDSVFSRFQDLLNSSFKSDSVIKVLNTLIEERSEEVSNHQKRWNRSLFDYQKHIDGIRFFLEHRPLILLNQIDEKFYHKKLCKLKISANLKNACLFNLNTILGNTEIDGYFFKTLPLTITAIPNDGYKFVGWNIDTSSSNTITLYPEEDNLEIIAYFEKIDVSIKNDIVINEIMYKAPDDSDCKDWIELYNNSDHVVDLSGWSLKDSDDEHIYQIPENAFIDEDKYLVLSNDTNSFNSIYSAIVPLYGNFNYGLGRGDIIRLYNPFYELEDIVEYGIDYPWPVGADGTGYSLELIHPNRDNSEPSNWKTTLINFGTPGEKNSIYNDTGISNFTELGFSIFPNPASSYLYFRTNEVEISIVDIKIIDIFGNTVLEYKNNFCNSYFSLDIRNFVDGYFLVTVNYMKDNKIQNNCFKLIVNNH